MKDKSIYMYFLPGIVVFSFLYLFLFYLPLNSKIKEKKEQINKIEKEIAKAKLEAKKLNLIKSEIRKLETEMQNFEMRMQREKNVPKILEIIARNALKFKLSIESFDPPKTIIPAGDYSILKFQIKYKGNYHSLANFLSAICQEEIILSVTNLEISSIRPTTKEKSIKGAFTLLSYIFK